VYKQQKYEISLSNSTLL